MKYALILISLFFFSLGHAQQEKEDFFLVEFDKFSPPEKELIKNFENFPAPPFLAPDIDGVEHYSANYKGKTVLVWFWSIHDETSLSQLTKLNDLQSMYNDQLQIISFAEESKSDMLGFREDSPISFPVIFQSRVFGEAAYAGDLGQSRIFIIDEDGIIKKVLPRSAFAGTDIGVQYLELFLSQERN